MDADSWRGRRAADVDALLAAAPDAMVVVAADGTIERANARCERLLGYGPGELVGQPAEVLVPTDLQEQHKAVRDRYFENPTVRDMGTYPVLHARRKDGEPVSVEISLGPFQTEDGPMVLAALRRVSRSRHDEGLFRRFLEAAPDAVLIIDDSGRIILVNAQAEALFGYPRAELLGHQVEVLLPDRLADGHRTFRASYVEDPRPRPIGVAGGLLARRKDGTEVPVEISLSPLETDEGVLVLADVRDITERLAVADAIRKAEERQRVQDEANRVKDDFLATISHELRTPLASIVGFSELIIDVEELSPQLEHFMSIIARNARRELRLVDDLLTLVKITEGGLRIRPELVNLVTVVQEAVESVRLQAEESGITLSLELPGSRLEATCDGERVGQALDNLLSNALKFTPAGGDVVVRLEQDGGQARIVVVDSGPGIDEADPERIFDRLYRSQTAVAQEVPGAGLGLSIAAAIVAAHEGTLRVASTGAQGSTFEISIPLGT